MFLGIFRYLFGWVRFSVQGNFAERFINLCTNRGLSLWGARRHGESFTLCTKAAIYKKLRPYARKAGVRLRIQQKVGLPFRAYRYRKRSGLVVGVCLFSAFLLVMNNFIWVIEINGNQTVSSQDIRAQLQSLGVKPGAYRSGLDARDIERNMMIQVDEIGWIAVNLRGSRAYVDIKERVQPPAPINPESPCNIIATQDGVVKRIEAFVGQTVVQNDDTVRAGDVIISGVIEDKRGHNYLVPARGNVYALVEDSLEVTVEFDQVTYHKTDALRRYSIGILDFEYPLWIGKPPQKPYKLEKAKQPLVILGLELPIYSTQRRYILLKETMTTLTPAQALAKAEEQLAALERQKLADCKILSRQVQATEGETGVTVIVSYTLYKNIAKMAEIFTN